MRGDAIGLTYKQIQGCTGVTLNEPAIVMVQQKIQCEYITKFYEVTNESDICNHSPYGPGLVGGGGGA